MAVKFIQSSITTASASTVTITLSASNPVAKNVLIVFFEQPNLSSSVINNISGWEPIGSIAYSTGTISCLMRIVEVGDTQTFTFNLPNSNPTFCWLAEYSGASWALSDYQFTTLQSSSPQGNLSTPSLTPNKKFGKYIGFFAPNVSGESQTSISFGFTTDTTATNANGFLAVSHQIGATPDTSTPISVTSSFSLIQQGVAASLIINPAPSTPYIVQSNVAAMTGTNATATLPYNMVPGNIVLSIAFQLNHTDATTSGGWVAINNGNNGTGKILASYWIITGGSYNPSSIPTPLATGTSSNWEVYNYEIANIRTGSPLNAATTNTGGVTAVGSTYTFQGKPLVPTWIPTFPIVTFLTTASNPTSVGLSNGFVPTTNANSIVGIGAPTSTFTTAISSILTYSSGASSNNVVCDLILLNGNLNYQPSENFTTGNTLLKSQGNPVLLSENFTFLDVLNSSVPFITIVANQTATDYFDVPFYPNWHVTARELNNLAQYSKGASNYLSQQVANNYQSTMFSINHEFQRGITVGGAVTFNPALSGLVTGPVSRNQFTHSMEMKTPTPLQNLYPTTAIDPNLLLNAITTTGTIATLQSTTSGISLGEYVNGLPANSLWKRQLIYDNLGNPNVIYGFIQDGATGIWSGTYLIAETVDALNNTCLVFIVHYTNLGSSPNILYNGNLVFLTNGKIFGISDNQLAPYQNVNFTNYQIGYYSPVEIGNIGITPQNPFYGINSNTVYASAGNVLNSASTYNLYINPFFTNEDFLNTATCTYGLFYPNSSTKTLTSPISANHLSSVTNAYVKDGIQALGGTLTFLGGQYAASNTYSLSVNSGPAGTAVTLTGVNLNSNFNIYLQDLTHPANYVTFVNTTTMTFATPPYVPIGLTEVVVTNGSFVTTIPFTVTYQPTITSLSTSTAPLSGAVSINGYGFGATQGNGNVLVDVYVAPITSWSDSQINIAVPGNARHVATQIKVTINTGQSDNFTFFVS